MRIAWVVDYTSAQNPTGGAEATNRLLIDVCPHPVVELTPLTLTAKKQLTDNDLIVLGGIKWFSNEQIEWMLDCPRIRYEHDYWNLVELSQEQYKKEIWDGCRVCIFHSPAHFKSYSGLYPELQFRNVWFQPSAMSVDKVWVGEKEDITISVGAIVIHKGVLDALQMMASRNEILHVYGTPDSPVSAYYQQVINHPNISYHGVLPYTEMLDVFARAKRFIFLPVWVEPYGRVVAEARLAGCELTLNDRVGALSYDWWSKPDNEFREILKQKVNDFWKVLDLV